MALEEARVTDVQRGSSPNAGPCVADGADSWPTRIETATPTAWGRDLEGDGHLHRAPRAELDFDDALEPWAVAPSTPSDIPPPAVAPNNGRRFEPWGY
jgi:hypothetical protein